jgi:transcriptional regulator with XRE-family HTH domain
MTQVALARELGVSTGYLNDVLQERREPGPKVLKALRLRRRVVYETIGKR